MTKKLSIIRREKNILQTPCEENWIVICKGMKLDYHLISHTKVMSQWIKNCKTKSEITGLSAKIIPAISVLCDHCPVLARSQPPTISTTSVVSHYMAY